MDGRERVEPQSSKKIPEWARGIQLAYSAYRQVREEEDYKLGKIVNSGQLWGECMDRVGESLTSFLDSANKEDLPEVILLSERQTQQSIRIPTSLGELNFQSNPYGRYFLPRIGRIYRVGLNLKGEPTESKFIPGSPDFVNTEQIKQYLDYIRYRPPDSPDSRTAKQKPDVVFPYNIYFDAMVRGEVMHYGKPVRKTWNLSFDDIDKIMQHLVTHSAAGQTKKAAVDLESKIQELKEKTRVEEEETKQRLASAFQSRINSLKEEVIRTFGKNILPSFIKLKLSESGNQTWYLTNEGKIVKAPSMVRKSLLGMRKTEAPDLTKAQEAPQEVWLTAHRDLAGITRELLKPLPASVRNQIRGDE